MGCEAALKPITSAGSGEPSRQVLLPVPGSSRASSLLRKPRDRGHTKRRPVRIYKKPKNRTHAHRRISPNPSPQGILAGLCAANRQCPMRIHVSFIDRVGITQEVLAILGGRNLNLDAVEMVPPNVYIDAPTLSHQMLEELKDALFRVRGVEAITVVDILPGQRRHLQLDALLAAMTDPVLALDSAGHVLLANPALIALIGREPAGEPIAELFADPGLQAAL
ncbi:putative Transcriptional regulator TyrR, partial [Pseudomonas syringae pv. viburni]